MSVLIFGGSFDPPHFGHLHLLTSALRTLRPCVTYLLPAYRSPLKGWPAASPEHRLRLTRLLVQALPAPWRRRTSVHPFEIDRGRTTYTYQAVRFFQRRHPSEQLWFLAGSDALASLSRWRRSHELLGALRWVIGRRPGTGIPEIRPDRRMILRRTPPDISSTSLRVRLLTGSAAARASPARVLSYVRRHGLYGLGPRRRLRKSLSPKRYRHSLCVARLAADLAARNGLDAEAAALAGLFHDCGRRFDLRGMVRYASTASLPVPHLKSTMENAPLLLHAHISADLARKRWAIRDSGVLSAIRNHTLGKTGMPLLDRVLYIADIASQDRGFPEAGDLRRLARADLGAAFLEAVRTKQRTVLSQGLWMHPGSANLWNWAVSGCPDRSAR